MPHIQLRLGLTASTGCPAPPFAEIAGGGRPPLELLMSEGLTVRLPRLPADAVPFLFSAASAAAAAACSLSMDPPGAGL